MIPLQKPKEFLDLSSGSYAQMRLRGHHLGTAAALEGRKYSDAAPQASQIDTIPSSTGMLPSPSHCSPNSTASAVTRMYPRKR
jgi:hypothetical protein